MFMINIIESKILQHFWKILEHDPTYSICGVHMDETDDEQNPTKSLPAPETDGAAGGRT